VGDSVRSNNIPTLDYLEGDALHEVRENVMVNYVWAATIIEFISDTWGMEYVVEMNRRHGDYQGIFGINRAEFERRWHAWLRVNYS
jgi:hypothetical protein